MQKRGNSKRLGRNSRRPGSGTARARKPVKKKLETRARPMPAAVTAAATPAAELPELAGRRIHFMGAGGIGVSALMELARARGAVVSGCDGSEGGQIPHLRETGIDVAVGHDPAHAELCDELVHTAAVAETHPEVARAKALGKPVSTRMKMLGRIARQTRAICVTGSHGKTTLTWMIAHLLIHAGRDPSVMVGGVVPSLESNVRIPRGRTPRIKGEFVVEVDESDNRLCEVLPTLPVVTNIDNDHLEHYGTIDDLVKAIARWLATAAASDSGAALVGCGDDARVRKALAEAARVNGLPAFDYGFDAGRTFRAENVRSAGMTMRFDAAGPFGHWRDLEIHMPGRHNVVNALGALTVAWRLGLDEQTVGSGLASCERVGRRFEVKGEARGVRVVDDYGHHPAEIAMTLRAAKSSTAGRVAVVFQPHRYTRTEALLDDFAACFKNEAPALVIVLPVYAASEKPIAGADHRALVERIRAMGLACAEAAESRAEAVARMAAWAQDGDTVLIQGAGDVTEAAQMLLTRLKN
ncbi:MAG: UDP-N-acetylmuramate--L-alanine ligase [Planctomycetes bacterium]|nr:UDP-N-acetylmuramate--L-alanine ligase [Planctomycetota bacterium]